ncbi:MAG TPA: histidinol-phosphate transaminase [Candidatus Limnocylindrales bacterium]
MADGSPRPASQVYTWEPSNAAIAARYGLRPEDVLRFDTNTSPLPPPFVADVLAETFEPPLNEYPDSSYEALTAAAAAYTGAEPNEVIVGAGADEVLDLVAKAYLAAGSSALVPIPTYAMYGVLTTQRAARIVSVPRLGPEDRWSLNVERVVAELPNVSVAWLCAPNNPTGAPEPEEKISTVLDASAKLARPPLMVVDEAYFEFTNTTVVPWRHRYSNLLAVRTVSKAFALAGARVGFAVGARSVIERLERVRPPGSISTTSAHLATRALMDPAYALQNVRMLSEERDWLAAQLTALGWPSTPSVTNFLLVRVGDNAAAEQAADGLLQAGIVPRTFGPANPLRGHLRLTVRTRDDNEHLVDAARALAS